jgi:hypothetical protein
VVRLQGREKSIALEWKALLVLPGQGRQEKREQGCMYQSRISIKGPNSGRPFGLMTIFF